MGNQSTRYPPEFKIEAVRLYRETGRSQREIASELGVATETLGRWVRRIDIDQQRRPGLTTSEREELHKLRREVRILAEERDILKKAAAFFAREEQRTR